MFSGRYYYPLNHCHTLHVKREGPSGRGREAAVQGITVSAVNSRSVKKKLVALGDCDEIVSLEGCATDQTTIDVLLRKEFLGV